MSTSGLNIKTKLFLLLSGLTISVLILVLVAVNHTSSTTIRNDILNNFSQLQNFFKTQQQLQYDRFLETAILLAENSTFKGNVETGDSSTVSFSVLEFSQFAKADLFIVTDEKGKTLGWFTHPEYFGRDISDRIGVRDALRGIPPPYEPEWAELWYIDNQLYQTATAAIYTPTSQIMGSITVGSEFRTFDAKALREDFPVDVTFFYDNQLIATSIDNPDTTEFIQIANQLASTIDSVTQNTSITEPFQLVINGEENLAFISPLGTGERAYYLASTPIAKEFESLADMRRNIFIIAAISIIAIMVIAYSLGSFVSTPINNLTHAMLKVQEGDLEVTVKSTSKDEIGILTNAFNTMIIGLRERFALTKYVGDHTLKMIQNNEEVDLNDGGTRQTLAILFTDIRGSTNKISTTSPEQFINMLNRTLSDQSDAVLLHDGSIDKFVGDSLIALFAGKDALKRAIQASIDIQKSYYSDKEVSSFFNGLGVGVNYGSMVLGNMGAKERMDYTVIGAQVNLCARLCHEAKPGQILIPEHLIKENNLDKLFSLRPVESKNLKGFSSPVNTVEVLYE